MTNRVLVTGGAGYIGSHVVHLLIQSGYSVVVVDNLVRGHKSAVHPDATFHAIDVRETEALQQILWDHNVSAVLHFAAYAYVGESVEQPIMYYKNNMEGLISLVDAMLCSNTCRLVFSSSCATYGIPASLPIIESMTQQPVNPYGWTKLFAEQYLKDVQRAFSNQFALSFLRYFNVAGCHRSGILGEDHKPETHVVPLLLQTAMGKREHFTILGTDYPTTDGTCIRDFIHVEDLASAHLLALEHLQVGVLQEYNLGIGDGFSVRDVARTVEDVTGKPIPIVEKPRRPGDPPVLVASSQKIQKELGWKPEITTLHEMVATSWNWMKTHPDGYAD